METMLVGIISTLISSGVTLAVCLINNNSQNKKLISDIKTEFSVTQAVTDTKIEELTREVRAHNNFAQRMPVVENEIKHIEDDLKTLHGYHQN
jgi:hypothetical protein